MAVDFLSALGAGSGIDTKSLAQSLVDAEKAPLEGAITRRKESAELDISAYGMVKSSLQALKVGFDGLKDLSDLKDFNVTNGASSSLSVDASSSASAGTHSIQINQLADRDIWSSNGFGTGSDSLNSGSDITISLTINGTVSNVLVSSPTPAAIVTAINDADLGIDAQLVDVGTGATPYVISLSGGLGADNSFTVSSNSADISFGTQLSTASDSVFTVNGMSITRSSNSVSDVLTGVTLELSAVMASAQTFTIQKDTAKAKLALENFVSVYNDVNVILKSLSAGDDPDNELAGSLNGDSVFRSIVKDVKDMVTGLSSTASGNISYLADIGISFQRDGSLAIDDSKLNNVLSGSFDDVVTMLSAGTENQTQFGDFNRGLAGDASKELFDLLASTGEISAQIASAQSSVTEYESDLQDLEARMEQVYDRYLKQFTAMQSFVDQMNNTRDYLEQQMKALPYNNRD
jgi:flagellar hook-associated protein 2